MVAQSITAAPAGEVAVRDLEPRLASMLAAAFAGAQSLRLADRAKVLCKPDGTPQTEADLMSDRAIREVLSRELPDLPVVSEESRSSLSAGFAERPFLLVDPLDGTREFLEGHADHAVCVALIADRRPVLGAIVAPALRKAWTAGVDAREWTLDAHLAIAGSPRLIRAATGRESPRHLVTSRSRPDPFAAAVMPRLAGATLRPVGAVLKLVAVATGEACLFPAGNPSSEWDIAAGEALVIAAGGTMLGVDGRPLTYGNADDAFRHPPYAAGANERIVRDALAQWPAN
jgi:3'(2'), 5'-bisphosphate nucleotidase